MKPLLTVVGRLLKPHRHIIDLLPGLQVRVVPATMPPTTSPLPPWRPTGITRLPRAITVEPLNIIRTIRGRASSLRRTTKQHPAQHRDLFRQLRDPDIQLRKLAFGTLGTLTPVGHHIGGIIDHTRRAHVTQDTTTTSLTPRVTPNDGVSQTIRKSDTGITHQPDKSQRPTGSPNT
jgi:hypothetical protein